MDYEYFHAKSRDFLTMAYVYMKKKQFQDALWCCKVSLEFENRAFWGLIESKAVTQWKNELTVWEIECLTNWINKELETDAT